MITVESEMKRIYKDAGIEYSENSEVDTAERWQPGPPGKADKGPRILE